MRHKFLPIDISLEALINFLRTVSHDGNYVPTDNEIASIVSLLVFFNAFNFYFCWLCKYIYWFVCGGMIWLVYLDNGVD
jgi:hypothetical protein